MTDDLLSYQSDKAMILSSTSKSCKWGTIIPVDEMAILQQVEDDYVAALHKTQEIIARAERTVFLAIYITAVAAFRLAELLHENDEIWQKFKDEPFWKGHSSLSRSRCLSYALMFFYNGHQGQAADKARAHARALEHYFFNHIPAEDVLHRLQHDGGFNGTKRMLSVPAVADRESARSKTAIKRLVIDMSAEHRDAFEAQDIGTIIIARCTKSGPNSMLVNMLKQSTSGN